MIYMRRTDITRRRRRKKSIWWLQYSLSFKTDPRKQKKKFIQLFESLGYLLCIVPSGQQYYHSWEGTSVNPEAQHLRCRLSFTGFTIASWYPITWYCINLPHLPQIRLCWFYRLNRISISNVNPPYDEKGGTVFRLISILFPFISRTAQTALHITHLFISVHPRNSSLPSSSSTRHPKYSAPATLIPLPCPIPFPHSFFGPDPNP